MIQKEDFKSVYVDSKGDEEMAIKAVWELERAGFYKWRSGMVENYTPSYGAVCAYKGQIDFWKVSLIPQVCKELTLPELTAMVDEYLAQDEYAQNNPKEVDEYAILREYFNYLELSEERIEKRISQFIAHRKGALVTLDELKSLWAEKHGINVDDIKVKG